MKLNILKDGLKIIPENELEISYIENTLRLREGGDYVKLVRVHTNGDSNCILVTEPKEEY